jgi:arsenate reductase
MKPRVRVLFLCTANACRSQMAEALLRRLGGDRFEAFSAGSHPSGFIHPLAIESMRRLGVSLEGRTSKSWDEFAATPLDVVITVCDRAAAETCPVWPGAPLCVHWSLPDPVQHPGSESEQLAFAQRVAERLRRKIQGLVDLDWSIHREEFGKGLRFLGEI